MDVVTLESTFIILNQGWVGSAIGLTGILLSVLFFRRSKRKAKPSIQFSRITILSPRSEEVPSDVEILYKGNRIEQLFKTNVIFWNDGTETLHGSSLVDDSPIQIAFEEGETILRHQIVKETRPVNRSRLETVEGKSHAVNIQFDYLDPKDGFNIEILHNSKSDPIITGDIRGIPSGIRIVNSIASPSSPFRDYLTGIIKKGGPKVPGIIAALSGIAFVALGVLSKMGSIDIKNVTTAESEANLVMIMGCLYTLGPLLLLWLFRKRYPKALND